MSFRNVKCKVLVSATAGYYGTAYKDELIVVDRQTAQELEEKKIVQIIEKSVNEPETGSQRERGGMWNSVSSGGGTVGWGN